MSSCQQKSIQSLAPTTTSTDFNKNIPSPSPVLVAAPISSEPTTGVSNKTSNPEIVEIENSTILFPFCTDGKWGYMNNEGETMIAPVYDRASPFSEDLADVRLKEKLIYLDRSGNPVFELSGLHLLGHPFHDGLAVIQDGTSVYIVDRSGKKMFATITDAAMTISDFSENLSRISGVQNDGFIDTSGKWAIPSVYDQAHSFSQGIAAVRKGEQWGYIDKSGKLIIDFQAQSKN